MKLQTGPFGPGAAAGGRANPPAGFGREKPKSRICSMCVQTDIVKYPYRKV